MAPLNKQFAYITLSFLFKMIDCLLMLRCRRSAPALRSEIFTASSGVRSQKTVASSGHRFSESTLRSPENVKYPPLREKEDVPALSV